MSRELYGCIARSSDASETSLIRKWSLSWHTVISDAPYLGEICVSICSTDPRSVAFYASIKALKIQVSKIQFWSIFELSTQKRLLCFSILLSIIHMYIYFFFSCHSNNNSKNIKTISIPYEMIYILFFYFIFF